MSKQSCIDWLEKEFVQLEYTIGVHSVMYKLLDKAKAMHKEEIESAYFKGYADNMNDEGDFEEYYNETFGGDNE
jgi:hypothetical protein